MKLRKGRAGYKMPAIGQFLHVDIDERGKGGHRFVVQHLRPEQFQQMLKEKKKYLGRPVYFTHIGEHLYVYPTPDSPYELSVVFYPPAQRL